VPRGDRRRGSGLGTGVVPVQPGPRAGQRVGGGGVVDDPVAVLREPAHGCSAARGCRRGRSAPARAAAVRGAARHRRARHGRAGGGRPAPRGGSRPDRRRRPRLPHDGAADADARRARGRRRCCGPPTWASRSAAPRRRSSCRLSTAAASAVGTAAPAGPLAVVPAWTGGVALGSGPGDAPATDPAEGPWPVSVPAGQEASGSPQRGGGEARSPPSWSPHRRPGQIAVPGAGRPHPALVLPAR
jgi:hypothetical protein